VSVKAWLVVVLALAASGCISLSWSRSRAPQPLDPRWVELEVGSARLEDALALLGAPLYVYEHERSGAVLVWGRGLSDDKGINLSVPVSDQGGSADFDYSRVTSGLRGVMMVFDSDWRLALAREGYLHDLTAGHGARPSAPLETDRPPAQGATEE
jgi:hypothetical protein